MGITGPAFEWIQVDGNKKLTISRLFSKILGEPHRCSTSTRHQVYEKEQLYKGKYFGLLYQIISHNNPTY